MKHESELVTASNEGFRKWLNIEELGSYIDSERARVAKAPELYFVVFNTRQGYVQFDASVVKMVRAIDEAGKLLDIELKLINDDITSPIPVKASAFMPDTESHVSFCRVFSNAKDRDAWFEDIKFMTELSIDYKLAMIEAMRRQMRF